MAGQIYIISRGQTGEWALVCGDDFTPLCLGPFAEVWDYGIQLAGRAETALLRAVNDLGETIAQEVFTPGRVPAFREASVPPRQTRVESHRKRKHSPTGRQLS
jgi:hypothetical protein